MPVCRVLSQDLHGAGHIDGHTVSISGAREAALAKVVIWQDPTLELLGQSGRFVPYSVVQYVGQSAIRLSKPQGRGGGALQRG